MENLWSDCWILLVYWHVDFFLLDVGCSWVELAVEPWECRDANCAVQQICLLPTSVFDVTWRRSMINLKDAMPSSYHEQHFAARSFAFKRKSRRSGVVYVTLHTQNIGHISALWKKYKESLELLKISKNDPSGCCRQGKIVDSAENAIAWCRCATTNLCRGKRPWIWCKLRLQVLQAFATEESSWQADQRSYQHILPSGELT